MIDRTGNGKWSKWIENYCPECETPIKLPKQIRCDFCKVLFDWEDDENVSQGIDESLDRYLED